MRALLQCLCVSLTVLIASCSDEASEIGSNFFNSGSLNMTAVDTLTLKVSTVKFDSMVTNDASRFLVGYHEDADLGVTTSSAYFQLGVDGELSIDKLYTTYTRAELRLIHDGYSFYDTTKSITFSVHRIAKPLETVDYFYNTSSVKYDPTPLGTITYNPRPVNKDTVKIPISDDLGLDIIRLAQSSGTQVSSTTDFIKYFNGLVLVPSNTNGPIVGFGTGAQLRVYYTDKAQTPSVQRYLSLSHGSNTHYNKIGADRSSTKLSNLVRQRNSLSSKETDNKAYLQCGVGEAFRISIPYLRRIMIDNPDLAVVNATLQFSPVKGSDGNNVPFPKTLAMTSIDYQNNMYSLYSDYATLVDDPYLGRDTHYTVDITAYIKAQLLIEEFNDNGIIFTVTDATLRSTVDRLYIGDQLNERPMKVTLNCLTYQK